VAERRRVLDPEAVAGAPVWPFLRGARERGVPRRAGLRDLRRMVRREFGPVARGRLRRVIPLPA
jgi:hypothetical protein